MTIQNKAKIIFKLKIKKKTDHIPKKVYINREKTFFFSLHFNNKTLIVYFNSPKQQPYPKRLLNPQQQLNAAHIQRQPRRQRRVHLRSPERSRNAANRSGPPERIRKAELCAPARDEQARVGQPSRARVPSQRLPEAHDRVEEGRLDRERPAQGPNQRAHARRAQCSSRGRGRVHMRGDESAGRARGQGLSDRLREANVRQGPGESNGRHRVEIDHDRVQCDRQAAAGHLLVQVEREWGEGGGLFDS